MSAPGAAGSAPPAGHWPVNARNWDLLGPPLRPHADDLAPLARIAAGEHAAPAGAPPPRCVLILGVTPELALLPWAPATCLVAADRCHEMIAAVWPRERLRTRACAVRAEWTALPLAAGRFDLVLGDGVTVFFVGCKAQERFYSEVRRVLRRGGLFALRPYLRPERAESLDAVAADLWTGRIGSIHAFKWRLAMALHGPPERGVALRDVWLHWRKLCPDPAVLTERFGWPPGVVGTMDFYRDSPLVYCFPTLAELRDALAGAFSEVAFHVPSYELGDRCPTLVLRARG